MSVIPIDRDLPRRSRCCRFLSIGLLFFASCLFLPQGLRGEDVRLVFAPVPKQPTAGGNTALWLHWLNSGTSEATALPPLNIQGTLIQGALRLPVKLRIASPYNTAPLAVAAGGFVRREYFVQLPLDVSGKVVLELDLAETHFVALDIAPGRSAQAPKAAPVEAADKEPTAPAPVSAPVSAPVAASVPDGGKPADSDSKKSAGAAALASDSIPFFREHFFPHEPLYFVAGTESPNAKFQVSFKYQLFSKRWPGHHWSRSVTNLFIGYTQTSLWDWNRPSAPFFDSSYKPELLYSVVLRERREASDWVRVSLQAGVQHESNGRDGASSRSLNNAYVRPTLQLGREGGFQVSLAPRVLVYLGDLSDNPDIGDYRGHLELRGVFGWQDSIQASIVGRIGDDLDRGNMQVDLTYPMWKLPVFKSNVFLDVQYFNGYGESLLLYNQRSWAVRAGFALSR